MGIANRIINILVLIAAIAAIILGIMLFNKREDVALSRKKMADAIATNTNKLIETTDEKTKRDLTVSADNMAMKMTSDDVQTEVERLEKATKLILDHQKKIGKDYAETVNKLTDKQYTPSADSISRHDGREKEVAKINEAVEKHNQKIANTRKEMQNAITTIGNTLKVENAAQEVAKLNLADAEDLKKYAKIMNDVNSKGNQYVKLFETMTPEVNELYKALNDLKDIQLEFEKIKEKITQISSIDPKEKFSNDKKEELEALRSEISDLKLKIVEVNTDMAAVAKSGEVPEITVTAESDIVKSNLEAFRSNIKNIITNHNGMINMLNDALEDIVKLNNAARVYYNDFKNEEAKAKDLKEQVEGKQKEIAELQKKVKHLEDENRQSGVVARRVNRLAPDTNGKVAKQQEPSYNNNELLKKVQGKVLYVNLETGIVLLNIGTETRVEVKDAKGKVTKVPVVIGQDVIMTVTSNEGHVLGKVRLYRLEGSSSVANILPSPNGMKSVPVVGSNVIFTEQDFAAMRERNLKAIEEERKAAAAAEAAAAEAAAGQQESSADVLKELNDSPAAEPKAAEPKAAEPKADQTSSDDVF